MQRLRLMPAILRMVKRSALSLRKDNAIILKRLWSLVIEFLKGSEVLRDGGGEFLAGSVGSNGRGNGKRVLISWGLEDAGMLNLLFQKLWIAASVEQKRDWTSGQHVVNKGWLNSHPSLVIQKYRYIPWNEGHSKGAVQICVSIVHSLKVSINKCPGPSNCMGHGGHRSLTLPCDHNYYQPFWAV